MDELPTDDGKIRTQSYTFDFFNYAGIHRTVHLYRTPRTFIEEVILETDVTASGVGELKYQIQSNTEPSDEVTVKVSIFDRNGTKVAAGSAETPNEFHSLVVPSAKLWWPYLMHSDPGYLYELEVRLSSPTDANVDVYRMKFGFRKLSWSETGMQINGKAIYFRGFGRHEDSDVSGGEWGANLDVPKEFLIFI